MLCLSMQWLLRLLWPFSLFYWTYAFYWRILFFSPNNNSVSDIDLHWQIFYFILFSWVFRGKPQNKQQKMFNETALIRVNAQVECYRMIQKIGWRQTHNRQVYFGEIISLKLPPNFIIQLAQFKSLSFDTFYMQSFLEKEKWWLSMRNKIIVGTLVYQTKSYSEP